MNIFHLQVGQRNRKMLRQFGMLLVTLSACCGLGQAQSWTEISTQFTVGWETLLLTGGRVLIQDNNNSPGQGSKWWALTPQKYTLNYSTGTFTPVGALQPGYCPLYFAAAVLPDGKAVIAGGEHNRCGAVAPEGAIFDPTTNLWTPLSGPPGWTHIEDAQSVILPTGPYANEFMIGSKTSDKAAVLDPTTLAWTVLTSASGYLDKNDSNNEEGWTLLPDTGALVPDGVLTVDAYVGAGCTGNNESETYDATTGTWSRAGNTSTVQLWDSRLTCGCAGRTNEVGPNVLMYNGKVLATGANTCKNSMGKFLAGHTALYDTASGTWTKGPDIPGGNDMADAPAAVLITGHVLVDTNPGWGNSPSTFYLYNPDDGEFITSIPQPPGLHQNTEGGRLLLLPNGQALFSQAGYNSLWFFRPSGTYKASWQPTICSTVNVCYPATANIGGTGYPLMGTQFNGLSQGSFFGDDAQSATNYPLAVITNAGTGHKFFARTHSFSTMGVATGPATMVTAEFDVLPGTESGNSNLTLYTNGIPSNTVGFCVEPCRGDPGELNDRTTLPARQMTGLVQHAPDARRTHRHHVGVQHHEGQPPIAVAPAFGGQPLQPLA